MADLKSFAAATRRAAGRVKSVGESRKVRSETKVSAGGFHSVIVPFLISLPKFDLQLNCLKKYNTKCDNQKGLLSACS